MKQCPLCQTSFPSDVSFCSKDGARLIDTEISGSEPHVSAPDSDFDFDEGEEDSALFVKRKASSTWTPLPAPSPELVARQVEQEAALERAAANATGPVADLTWASAATEASAEPAEVQTVPTAAPARTPDRFRAWVGASWAATLILMVGGILLVGVLLLLGGLVQAVFSGSDSAATPELAPALPVVPIEEPDVPVVIPLPEEVDELEIVAPAPVTPEPTLPPAPAPPLEPVTPPEPSGPASPAGLWGGDLDGRKLSLRLSVDGARLTGTLTRGAGSKAESAPLTGTMLPKEQDWMVNLQVPKLHYQLIGDMGETVGSGRLLIRGRERGTWSVTR